MFDGGIRRGETLGAMGDASALSARRQHPKD
jgi:hypothetical protein